MRDGEGRSSSFGVVLLGDGGAWELDVLVFDSFVGRVSWVGGVFFAATALVLHF